MRNSGLGEFSVPKPKIGTGNFLRSFCQQSHQDRSLQMDHPLMTNGQKTSPKKYPGKRPQTVWGEQKDYYFKVDDDVN